SFRINDKYQTYVFETKDEKLVTGLILEETADRVKVIENPLAKAEAVVLKKSAILKRPKSPTAVVPKGVLERRTQAEILDRVPYLAARGDANHKLFQGEHHHEHGGGH